MAARFLSLLLTLATVAAEWPQNDQKCRYIPGDAGWPSQKDWQRLNATVGGRLTATVPLAHVCHDSRLFPAYNETACAALREAFIHAGAQTLYVVFSGPFHSDNWSLTLNYQRTASRRDHESVLPEPVLLPIYVRVLAL